MKGLENRLKDVPANFHDLLEHLLSHFEMLAFEKYLPSKNISKHFLYIHSVRKGAATSANSTKLLKRCSGKFPKFAGASWGHFQKLAF